MNITAMQSLHVCMCVCVCYIYKETNWKFKEEYYFNDIVLILLTDKRNIETLTNSIGITVLNRLRITVKFIKS